MTATPRYPAVRFRAEDLDAHPLALVGAVSSALRRAGAPPADVERYAADALSADYDHVLRTTMGWVTLS